MKLGKAIGTVLGICLFFVLNYLSIKYFDTQTSNPAFDFPKIVFGVDSHKLQDNLNTKIITVYNDGDLKHFLTNASTPLDALIENGYTISTMNKIITTSPMDSLTNHAIIVIKTYRVVSEDVTVYIPYEKLVQGNTLCQALSKEVIQQQGVRGVMTQTLRKTYEGGDLVATDVTKQEVVKTPINEITILEGPDDSPDQVPQIGYNCDYWNNYIDNNVSASAEEKQWLKFTMKWESGCNGESNKNYYKGLFQWDPCIWYEQFPNDNIFDGRVQVTNTLWKIRMGGNPKYMWPAVYKKYVATFGELSWLNH